MPGFCVFSIAARGKITSHLCSECAYVTPGATPEVRFPLCWGIVRVWSDLLVVISTNVHLLRRLGNWITLYIDWGSHWEQPRWKMLLGFFCTLENTTFVLGWFRSSHSGYSVCVDVFTLKLYYLHSLFLSFRACYSFPWCSSLNLNQLLDEPGWGTEL